MSRPIGCWFIILPVFLIAGACASTVEVARVPVLEPGGLEAILVAGDEELSDAFTKADPLPLHAPFSGPASGAILREPARLQHGAERREELVDTRRLVPRAAAKGVGSSVVHFAGLPPSDWLLGLRTCRAIREANRGARRERRPPARRGGG